MKNNTTNLNGKKQRNNECPSIISHSTMYYYMGWTSETVAIRNKRKNAKWREEVIRNRKLKNSTPSLNRILMPLLYLCLMLLLLQFAFHNIFTSSLLSRCLIHWPEFGQWTTVFSYGVFNRTIRDWLSKRVLVVSLQQCPFEFLYLTIYILHSE